MDTKLKLKLNEAIIENYLNAVTIETKTTDDIEMSTFVKSLSSGATLPADFNYKKDYWAHLEEKHK